MLGLVVDHEEYCEGVGLWRKGCGGRTKSYSCKIFDNNLIFGYFLLSVFIFSFFFFQFFICSF